MRFFCLARQTKPTGYQLCAPASREGAAPSFALLPTCLRGGRTAWPRVFTAPFFLFCERFPHPASQHLPEGGGLSRRALAQAVSFFKPRKARGRQWKLLEADNFAEYGLQARCVASIVLKIFQLLQDFIFLIRTMYEGLQSTLVMDGWEILPFPVTHRVR